MREPWIGGVRTWCLQGTAGVPVPATPPTSGAFLNMNLNLSAHQCPPLTSEAREIKARGGVVRFKISSCHSSSQAGVKERDEMCRW